MKIWLRGRRYLDIGEQSKHHLSPVVHPLIIPHSLRIERECLPGQRHALGQSLKEWLLVFHRKEFNAALSGSQRHISVLKCTCVVQSSLSSVVINHELAAVQLRDLYSACLSSAILL